MFVYSVGPIDFGWELLPTVRHFISNFPELDGDCIGFESFLSQWENAKTLARDRGWEGDFSKDPRVFFLPNPSSGDFLHGFVWKQKNNGITFIISEVELPWIN
jgi:hypothetical protein